MRKYGVFVAVLAVGLFISCESPTAFRSLPETDTSLFVDGDTVIFQRGTVARDVYNTVAYLFDDNEWHYVTGTWNRIITTTVYDLTQQAWEVVPFTRIRHDTTSVKTNPNNTGYLYTHTVFLYGTLSREIIFQRQTFNVNQVTERVNQPIEGDIIFTF